MTNRKKVLAFWGGHHETNVLDLAIDYVKKDYNVVLLCCDESVSMCNRNYRHCGLYCKICKQSKKEVLGRFASELKNVRFISDYLNNGKKKKKCAEKFDYNNTKELKDLNYHGVEIGFGAFSSYVSFTRHCNPLYNNKVKEYLDDMLHSEVLLINVIEQIVDEEKPDLMIFHNGRFAQYKPMLGVAQNRGIKFIASECTRDGDYECHNDFYNDVPHSENAVAEKIEEEWDRSDQTIRYDRARMFYENRRNAKPAGDKIYIKDQQVGLLPDNWNENEYNIVIFNSSEDEFCSISKEYDKRQLFPTQYVALTTIFEHYRANKNIHFYLRIHPNLEGVDDISHLALYKLKYDNVTIIGPSSSISSYALMDKCKKVVVFNSTMGVESAYWGKAVISLNCCIYDRYNITYKPQNEDELFLYLEDENLAPKYNEGILKYANYIINKRPDKQWHFQNYWKKKKMLGLDIEETGIFTFWGSKLLYTFANFVVNRIPFNFYPFAKYKKIPNDRDLWMLDIEN